MNMATNADYWILEARTGTWRNARKESVCCQKPFHKINKGERYLDTGEHDPGRQWATLKLCEKHANEETA